MPTLLHSRYYYVLHSKKYVTMYVVNFFLMWDSVMKIFKILVNVIGEWSLSTG